MYYGVRILGVVLVWMAGSCFSTEAKEIRRTTGLQISSVAFADGGMIPHKYAYKYGNVSPPLSITGVPPNARSLVLIVDDPDAPSKLWVHWLLANMPPQTVEIREGEVPTGADPGKNDFGELKWGGPMPPSGTHHYFFRLMALDTVLRLREGYIRGDLERAMKGHIIATAQIMGRFSATQ